MELLMNTQKECQQLEVYGEYLKKIPELLKQLETDLRKVSESCVRRSHAERQAS